MNLSNLCNHWGLWSVRSLWECVDAPPVKAVNPRGASGIHGLLGLVERVDSPVRGVLKTVRAIGVVLGAACGFLVEEEIQCPGSPGPMINAGPGLRAIVRTVTRWTGLFVA
jgi:hypothetical protein